MGKQQQRQRQQSALQQQRQRQRPQATAVMEGPCCGRRTRAPGPCCQPDIRPPNWHRMSPAAPAGFLQGVQAANKSTQLHRSSMVMVAAMVVAVAVVILNRWWCSAGWIVKSVYTTLWTQCAHVWCFPLCVLLGGGVLSRYVTLYSFCDNGCPGQLVISWVVTSPW